eukprot:5828815-Prymnesium_polylepis.1
MFILHAREPDPRPATSDVSGVIDNFNNASCEECTNATTNAVYAYAKKRPDRQMANGPQRAAVYGQVEWLLIVAGIGL